MNYIEYMYLCKKVLTVLMSGHLLPVDMKPIVMIVTVPVFQVELLHPVLLEITIYVNQPQILASKSVVHQLHNVARQLL